MIVNKTLYLVFQQLVMSIFTIFLYYISQTNKLLVATLIQLHRFKKKNHEHRLLIKMAFRKLKKFIFPAKCNYLHIVMYGRAKPWSPCHTVPKSPPYFTVTLYLIAVNTLTKLLFFFNVNNNRCSYTW